MAKTTTKKTRSKKSEADPATPSATATPARAPRTPKPAGSELKPGTLMTFTIKTVPARPAQQKTIRRLMRMQPRIQAGLKKLSIRRQRDVNQANQRGGRMWITRARTTKLTHVGAGETFSITVTPHIIPDIRSVQQFLDISKG